MDIVSPRNVKGALKCQSIQALRNCTALETPLLQTPFPTRPWMWPLYRQAVREYVRQKCCGVSHERQMARICRFPAWLNAQAVRLRLGKGLLACFKLMV